MTTYPIRRKTMTHLDRLGLAISDAGYVWTDAMRQEWDAAKDEETKTQENKVEERDVDNP